MRSPTSLLPVAILAFVCPLLLSAAEKPVDLTQFKDEAIVFEHLDTDVRYNADGTGAQTIHVVARTQTEAGARELSVLALFYASGTTDAEITGVLVHKADGTTVATPSADTQEVLAPVTKEAPMYSDLKQKQLPVRSLNPGDTIEYTLRYKIHTAHAPGHLWDEYNFARSGIVLSQTLTLHLPAGKYVQVWSPKYTPAITTEGDEKTYRWTASNLIPTNAKKTGTEEENKFPAVALTTFHNWAEVGAWYRSLSLQRAQPTDILKERAAAITKDAKTPEEKVQAIYSFVATRTRYIGIDFGVGRFQPHTAESVLDNQYGDCKDKDTLLEALLRSTGFETSSALIGAGTELASEVPSPGFFNHVITTVQLPSGRIWLDTTPELSPYRFLIPTLRDKQTLLIPATGDAHLERTPADPPFPFLWDFKAEGTLTDDGTMQAHISSTIRNDDELSIRTAIRALSPVQWDEGSQGFSRGLGFGGTTSHAVFGRPEETDKPFTFSWDYKRAPYGNWDNFQIVPLFPTMTMTYYDEKDPPKTEIDLGARRTEVATSRITVPAGYGAELPDAIHVKTSFATFDKTYKLDNGILTAERRIVVLKTKLPKEDIPEYLSFQKHASFDGERWIVLLPDKNKPVAKVNSKADDDSSARDLLAQAGKRLAANDLPGAKALLEQARAKNPNQPHLPLMAATIAFFSKDLNVAEKETRKEIEEQPDESHAVLLLSSIQQRQGKNDAAIDTLSTFFKSHPKDYEVAVALAEIQSLGKDTDSSVKSLRIAVTASPDSRDLRVRFAQALHRSGKDEEAASEALKAMDGSEDTLILNNGSDVLSETGLHLDQAEKNMRIVVTKLEEQSAQFEVSEANTTAFAQASLLVAAWDTLGWTLHRENKDQEALPLLNAAWINSQQKVVGYHLGQVLESSNKAEAFKLYQLAMATREGVSDPAVADKLSAAMAKLSSGEKTKVADPTKALQEARTFHLQRPRDITGWGTVRLQIGVDGVVSSQMVQGDEKVRTLTSAINSLKFPGMIPPQSHARLLRDAVLSCHSGPQCELVLMPNSGLNAERVQ